MSMFAVQPPKVMACMVVVTLRCTLQGGGALRQEGSKLCSRCGSHQTELGFLSGRLRKLDAPPMPPFPTSVSASAEFSGDSAEIQTRRYELFDAKRRGDSQWVPLCMREGKSYAPITAEDKAERLEREVVELKAALGQMRLSSSGSREAVPPPSMARASEFQGFVWGPDRGSGVGQGRDGVSPNDVWASTQKERPSSFEPREGGDMP